MPMTIRKLQLTLDNAQREFVYRVGIEDEVTIAQSLVKRAYDPGRLERGAELSDWYQSLAANDRRPLIVDAAANIGASAVFFAHKFPEAEIVAVEPDPIKFELLKENTAGLRVECIQARIAPYSGGDNAVRDLAISEVCCRPQCFLVKFAVEAGDPFSADDGWLDRTAVVIGELADHLVPGTALTRSFVERAANWGRDFVYLEDTIFSIRRPVSRSLLRV